MSNLTAANSTELLAAMKLAKGGETIILTGDDYGDFAFQKIKPTAPITIRSDNVGGLATFRTIRVMDSSNVTFDNINLQFTHQDTTKNLDPVFRVWKSSNVQLSNSTITGYDATTGVSIDSTTLDASRNVIGLQVGRGINIETSQNVVISNNVLSGLSRGIGFADSQGLTITNNQIYDLRTTGISGGGVSDVLIAGNHIHTSTPWNLSAAGDHGDYIHIWSRGTERSFNSNVKITGNLLEKGTGTSLMGIYIDDNDTGVGFGNYEISHNVILIADHQAMRLENVQGKVFNNTMVQADGPAQKRPLFVIVDNSDITLTKNISAGYSIYDGAVVRQSGNIIAQGNKDGPDNYKNLFNFDETDGVTLQDLGFKLGSDLAFQKVGANLNLFQHWLGDTSPGHAPAVGSALADSLSDMLSDSAKIGNAIWSVKPAPVELETQVLAHELSVLPTPLFSEHFGFA